MLKDRLETSCGVVIAAAIQFIFSEIWLARNKARFEDVSTLWKNSIKSITDSVRLVGNNSKKAACSSMTEFITLKSFNINVHSPKLNKIFPPNILVFCGNYCKTNSQQEIILERKRNVKGW